MDSYKLYKVLFYALDSVWDNTKNEELGNCLSGMNPFLFKDVGSADSAYYSSFKEKFDAKFQSSCTIEEGYEFCRDYIKDLNNDALIEAFNCKTLEDWIKAYGNK